MTALPLTARPYAVAVAVAAAIPAYAWTLGSAAATGWEHLPLVALTAPGALLPLPAALDGGAAGVWVRAAVGAAAVLGVLFGAAGLRRARRAGRAADAGVDRLRAAA
ncbi:hypothetical protein GCM10010123_35800 [Pilimelia anulata]|uniref:Uncharacterized protein n=1 Tax=Pilimelia anulata TaxID=53371 RepID=A0A8J3B885_9ACTN|nr:hypothetical protein [Pilimelia anulata]GGK02686.1 hypothetical protein GCM10010123_35800 [Pilimelia anulata]